MQIILSRCTTAPDLVIANVEAFASSHEGMSVTFASIAACDKAKFATGWSQSGPLTLYCPKWSSMNRVYHYDVVIDDEEHSYSRVAFMVDDAPCGRRS